jgi:hypothetical protein
MADFFQSAYFKRKKCRPLQKWEFFSELGLETPFSPKRLKNFKEAAFLNDSWFYFIRLIIHKDFST